MPFFLPTDTVRFIQSSLFLQFPAFSFDDNVISVKSSIVDIAHGYTKKKNVFRLKTYNGSEFLFQAEDSETMKAWIQTIQNNNDPDADVSSLFSISTFYWFLVFSMWFSG